jgi:hypothetical protein|tara:strand:- start:447 stop:773 length:327 start_codon:yes stop_codon:yes gene_type:complete
MTYVFDIDGTICSKTDGDYSKAKPLHDRIKKINNLYDDGHTIVFLTARGMGRHKNNFLHAQRDFFDLTYSQLERWGAKYHQLFLGKPSGDFYIDDKGISDEDFFNTGN